MCQYLNTNVLNSFFFPAKNESEKALREGILAKSAISVRWVVVEAMERERVSNFFFFFFFCKNASRQSHVRIPPSPSPQRLFYSLLLTAETKEFFAKKKNAVWVYVRSS